MSNSALRNGVKKTYEAEEPGPVEVRGDTEYPSESPPLPGVLFAVLVGLRKTKTPLPVSLDPYSAKTPLLLDAVRAGRDLTDLQVAWWVHGPVGPDYAQATAAFKEIALFGGEIASFVSPAVRDEVIARVEKLGRRGDF